LAQAEAMTTIEILGILFWVLGVTTTIVSTVLIALYVIFLVRLKYRNDSSNEPIRLPKYLA
ncbi:MAG: hypothetical protein MI744_14445, partial [Pseudomonadales bacterium]|nr:hypothetical protein [Pseudomonadales bacterium]